jgi:Protein of unknown function (DUF2637)
VNAELTGRPPGRVPGSPADLRRPADTAVRPAATARSADAPLRPAGHGADANAAGGRQLAARPARPPVSAVDDGRVAALDRLTLHLGVVVAAVIAGCSYAVSAASLCALGRQAGYAPWQAVAVPVVADGPAIYGMVRIVSRARRGAAGAGYGWLLVGVGTLASIAGNVAHARPELVARAIAAAIPLAVLAMLEALKGDTAEVARLAAEAATDPSPRAEAADRRPADTRPAAHRVGRADRAALGSADPSGVGELAALARPADASVRQRLQAAYAGPRTDGRPWTARTLAEAAGCGRTAAARFLQAQRTAGREATG